MKIRMKDSYIGPIPKNVSHDALKTTDGYLLVVEGRGWTIRENSAEEIDELEEEFNKMCKAYTPHKIGFSSVRRTTGMSSISMIKGEKGLYMHEEGYPILRVCDNEDIPALILALLKLMDE